jgi:hypothetical protein
MKVNATFDHRFIDGFYASVLSRVLREWFEHLYERFDRLDQMPVATRASSPAAALACRPKTNCTAGVSGIPVERRQTARTP